MARSRILTFSILVAVLLCSRATDTQPSIDSPHPSVRLENRRFIVDGRVFFVRGIHYGPWRPGTGPNKHYSYPDIHSIAADFELIRKTGANTVLIYDPPGEVVDLAQKYDLEVVYVFALDWWSIGGPGQQAITAKTVERVKELREKPALLAYVLGNEVPGDVLQSRGDEPIVAGLHEMFAAIKAVDPDHPISHANWPPARRLDLSFLDFISFNVYPLWPPEVVAMGFGNYLKTVLRPIAGGKPLLITEFGANTIEAGDEGQSRLIRDSWDSIVHSDTAGAIVFEFADEWWKNYNNPARPGDWWTRVPAPNDEMTHDQDPEEHYGIVNGDRTPKPALAVVTAMFGKQVSREKKAREFDSAAVSIMVVVAAGAFFWARGRYARRVLRADRASHSGRSA